MYRLFTILLYLEAATSAPQAKESEVTYVKIQPMVKDTPAGTSNIRQSRIEKLPLTFPGNVSTTDTKETHNLSEIESKQKQAALSEYTSDLPENKSNSSEHQSGYLTESLDQSETKQSDTIVAPNGDETSTTDDLSEINPTDDLSESNTDNLSDIVPLETIQSDRRARNFDSVETTETTVDATGKYEDEFIDHTAIDAPRTRAPPKFYPKVPKSSYVPKPRVLESSSANHLDIVGKRKFRSRCSCQKIWNCPKLQITVPRCPNEYFLCCF